MAWTAAGVQSGTDATLAGMSAVTGAVINDPLYVFNGAVDVTGSLTVPVESARFQKITARGTLVIGSDDGNPQSGNIIYLTQNGGTFSANSQPFSTINGANVTLRNCTIYFTNITNGGDSFGSFVGQAYTFACKNAKIISVGSSRPWHYVGGGGVVDGLYIRRAAAVFFTSAPTSVRNFQLLDSPWGVGLDSPTGATIRLSSSSIGRSIIQRSNNNVELLDTQLTEWLVARAVSGDNSAWRFLRTIGVAAIGSQAGAANVRIMDNANSLLASGTTNAAGVMTGQVIQWGQVNQNSMVLTPNGSEDSATNKVTASAIVNNTGNVHAAGQYRVPLRIQFLKYGAVFVAQTINTIDITNASVTVPLSLAPSVSTDVNITETNAATVAAYTQVSNLDQLYDLASLFKVNNPIVPTWDTMLVTASGTVLDLGSRNLVIDGTAASAFAVNTGTNTITIKATTLIAGTKFNSILTSGTVTIVNGGIFSNIEIIGNVTQATPTNLSNVVTTGTLTYNTNTATSITITNTTIGTVANGGTGIVTITPADSTITTYTDAQINYLDSNITFAGVDSITFYPTSGDANTGTNAGATITTSPYNFKYGSVISGVTMSETLNIRYSIGGKVTIGTLTIALGSNFFVLTDNELLGSINASVALTAKEATLLQTEADIIAAIGSGGGHGGGGSGGGATLAEIEASTVLAKEASVQAVKSTTGLIPYLLVK